MNFAINSKRVLEKSILDLKNSSSLTVKIGCELEFFLFGEFDKEFIKDLKSSLLKEFNIIYDLKREQGEGQYEINIHTTTNLRSLAEDIDEIRDFVIHFCQDCGIEASFAAKPKKDDCGSSMQFNISLHDGEENIFADMSSDKYQNLVSSLLFYSKQILFLSSQNEEDFLRFDLENNISLFNNKKYVAPTNYSYGTDNRTCLVRCLKNRLEYRIASSNCDVFLMLSAIIFCVVKSFEGGIEGSFKRIYGNSFDEVYDSKLLEGYEEAKENFLNGEICRYWHKSVDGLQTP